VIDFSLPGALTFDCYGTLIDWETGLSAVLGRWAARNGVDASGEELLAAFAEAESRAEVDHPSMLYPDILRLSLTSIARTFGSVCDDHSADELAHSVGGWPTFPDTADSLRLLKRRYKLAIVSNVDRASFALTRPKLGVDLDLIVTAEDVGSYKPNLGHFRAALDALSRLGISQDRVMHVAQSLYHDHVPAKQLGLTTVWINRRSGKAGSGATRVADTPVVPDAEFRSMAAFASAVECSFGSRE